MIIYFVSFSAKKRLISERVKNPLEGRAFMDNGASSYLRFLNGDDDAFAPIVRDYKDGLILYIDSFIHNLSIAEDLMEDTFVKLATKRPVFHNDSAFKTWLYAIARNLALDWCRQNARQRVVSVEELSSELTTMDSIELQYLRSEQRIQLHKALQKIKPEYEQVLYLAFFEGFSNAQIARIMRKNKRQIESLIYRAKQSLKIKLETEGFSYEGL